MLEAYSLNVTVAANTAVPFNNVTTEKGCTATLPSPSTVRLNKRGVYMVYVSASSAASVELQLFRDEVAQSQAQGTGTNPSFMTFVHVDRDSCNCCCGAKPVTLQLRNVGDAEATLIDCNIEVTKLC